MTSWKEIGKMNSTENIALNISLGNPKDYITNNGRVNILAMVESSDGFGYTDYISVRYIPKK